MTQVDVGAGQPPWHRSLAEVQHGLYAEGGPPVTAAKRPTMVARLAFGDADAALRATLAKPRAHGVRSLLVSHASAVLRAARQVRRGHSGVVDPSVSTLGPQLGERLARFEACVVSAECTYEVSATDASRCVDTAHHTLGLLDEEVGDHVDVLLRVLDVVAIDLAALLVRVAANLATEGRPTDAAYHCPANVRRALEDVVDEVRRASGRRGCAVPLGADLAGASLASAVRVLRAEAVPGGGAPRPSRSAWIEVAAHEYVAVRALDEHLPEDAHRPLREGLGPTLVGAAADVLCGARLLTRPGAFDAEAAWAGQTSGLLSAEEAWRAAAAGERAGSSEAQRIVLARLARATAAVALLDLRKGDRSSEQPPAPVDRPGRRQRVVTATWLADVRTQRGTPSADDTI